MPPHPNSRRAAAADPSRDPARPTWWGALAVRALLAIGLIMTGGLLVGLGLSPAVAIADELVSAVDRELLDFAPLPDDIEEPWQRSVITDRDGNILAVLRDENRKTVPIERVPDHVQQAVIATEDQAFREHEGVSVAGILRAAAGNVAAGEITAGGSTITQQIIKNLVVGTEQSYRRKVQEAVYAIQIEERLGKDAILELYLNDAYYANRVYGIATAAEFYWGKPVEELTVDEGALLAGLLRVPEVNEPIDHPSNAKARRDIVLGQMADEGYLSPARAARLQRKPVKLDVHPLAEPSDPFFIDYVKDVLLADPALGEDRAARESALLRGGLEVRTTLDPGVQQIAQESIAEVLDASGEFLGAITAVDPRTGEILAVGFGPKEYGRDPGQVAFNPAVPGLGGSGRQPGSSFKAFEVVAALESGITPAYTFDAAASYTHQNPACPGAEVGNYADASLGVLNMAAATARSSNTYFAHLVDLTGPDKLVDVAHRMGIDSDLEPYCSLVLGGQEVFPLEMASAFGTLANDGEHCEPYAVAQVRDRTGRVISRGREPCEQAIDEDVAANATSLLRGPIEGGTASANGQIGRPAAGKTGTTDDYRDAWFAGYVPQLSAAAWVGYEVPDTMTHDACGGYVVGGCLPTMVWQRFMTRAIAELELPVEDFPPAAPLPSATVPSVVGMMEEEAVDVLTEADYRSESVSVTHHLPAGTVAEQSPAGGSEAPEGSVVVLSISDGTGDPPVTETPIPETGTARPGERDGP